MAQEAVTQAVTNVIEADAPEDRLGMTEAQWAQWQAYTHGFDDQDESGIDLSHLRANLRLTPTERLEKHRRANDLRMEVRRAAAARLSRDTRRP